MDTDGEPDCLDYIWLRGAVAVDEARLAFDRPAVGDPTLYPSDHLGVVARVAVGRRRGSRGMTPAADARPMLRIAHRGDWRLAPENSLEALVLAAGHRRASTASSSTSA